MAESILIDTDPGIDDAMAIAFLLQPELFQTIYRRVSVGTRGYGDGQIIVDQLGRYDDGVETTICTEVDEPGLLALFKERILGNPS
jgi:inosine-uridine nucleoside N-ribohydrolase